MSGAPQGGPGPPTTPSTEQAELTRLEEEGWAALAGGDAAGFYGRVLDDDVVMLLPGGLVLRGAAEALPTMTGTPWDGFTLEDVEVRRPTAGTGVVTYGVVARRGDLTYSALMSSVYVRRDDGWRLVLHQQTPRDAPTG